ncbi:MAG: 30S ribosomal protein S6 [Clostridiales bacterium]|nr:30S ribosomal protein S6 [Clostridiales bacterium]
MRNYETMFILKPNVEEEQRIALIEKFKKIINEDGEVVSVDEWGVKRLAYEIEKLKDGYYVLINFNANTAVIAELERNYRISDDVIRFMVINLDEK